MTLTPEQAIIIYSDHDIMFVEALAGTGKTTTLREYSKIHCDEKILYLVFNKNMRKESKVKFPKNCETHTINSFAYKYMKDTFLKRVVGDYSTSMIINNTPELQQIFQTNRELSIQSAVRVINILNSFFESELDELSFFIPNQDINLTYAHTFYQKIKNGEIPVTHNMILKLFHDTFDFNSLGYDTVLIDEAQDLSRPMLNIINKIQSKKIFVGDERQSIYGFRNVINVFNDLRFKDVPRYKLTQSYRFGSNIADFVNSATNRMFGAPIEIRGINDDPGEIIVDKSVVLEGCYDAYITRTNAHLFDKAFELANQGKNVSIPFDWDYIKKVLFDVFYLKIGLNHKIESQEIKQYHDFQHMKIVTKSGGDLDMSFLVSVIEKHGVDMPEKIAFLERHLSSPKFADKILLTAHKAKGLEFFSVDMGEDFPPLSRSNLEEKNLVYVTITRAIERLRVDPKYFS